MEKDSIFKELVDSISFHEVKVFPPCSERFYQLFRSGNPTPYVYSESHLGECFKILEIKFGL